MAAPSFDTFSVKARSLYPTVTEDQIKEAYSTKYGGDQVRTQGPDLEGFSKRARELYPSVTDSQITEAYDTKYGASAGTSLKRAFKSSFARGGEAVGALVGGLGADNLGESIFDYWRNVGEKNAPATALQENIVDRPGLLAKPAYWAQALGGLGGSLAGPGMVTSPMLSGADVAGQTGSIAKGVGVGAAEEALNLVPLGRIAQGVPGRLANAGLMGLATAAPPTVEAAATGAPLGEALKQSLTAFPGGALGGLILGGGSDTARARAANPDEAAFRARMGAGAGTADPVQLETLLANYRAAQEPLAAPAMIGRSPDFTVDAEGQAQARGQETPPIPLLPAPRAAEGQFAVDPQGIARPMTEGDVSALAAPRQEAADLGLGEAARIDSRMGEQQALAAIPDTPAPAPAIPASITPVPMALPKRATQGPSAKHDSMLEYLARHTRGLSSEEARAQGIDPAAFNAAAANVGIKRAFRKGGMTFDEAAEHLHEAGYPVVDAQGRYDPNVLLDRIDQELGGQKVYSLENQMDQRAQQLQALHNEAKPDAAILAEHGLSHNEKNINETALVARAADLDEGMVERLAIQYDTDHEGFIRAIKGYLSAQDPNAGAPRGGQSAASADAVPTPSERATAAATAPSAAEPTPAAGGVEARKRAYYSRDQLSLDFETRPDTTSRQVRLGREALESILHFRDRRAGATVLGHGIPKEFAEHGSISLIDREARDEHELAQLAQVYRNPKIETLRFFLMRGDRVVDHYGATSRLPGAAGFKNGDYITDLARSMQALKADGYYILHNHPAGAAHPSNADVSFTEKLARHLPGFRAHVVIDHNEYAVIRMESYGEGAAQVYTKPFGGYDPVKNPVKPHDLLFEKISEPAHLAAMGSKLNAREGFTTLLGVDSHSRVRAIAEYPTAALSGKGLSHVAAIARVRRLQEKSGAGGYVFAVTEKPSVLEPLLSKGIITDAYPYHPGETRTYGQVHGTKANALESRNRSYRVQDEPATPYAAQPKVETAERPERAQAGGGDYSLKQFGRLTDTEVHVMTGVMNDLEAPIANQRRGSRSWDATEQAALKMLSQKYGVTLSSLVNRKKGSTANAEQLEAYAVMLNHAARDVQAAVEAVNATGGAPDMAKLAAAREKLGMLIAPAMGYRTEAGRSLNILKKIAGELKDANALFEALGEGSKDALQDFANRVKKAGNLDQIIGVTRESYTPDWIDKLLEYRISMGLLSGPATHSRNILSNALFNAMENAAHGLVAATTGHIPMRAFQARLAASVHGMSVGLSNARQAFMTEEGVLQARTKMETRPKAIGGKLGRFVRIPVRALAAEDEFFKGVAFHQELADLAMREAVAVSPRDPHTEFNHIMGDVMNRPELVDAAHKAAARLTFQDPLGRYGGMFAALASKGGVRFLRLIVPFIRTPANILKRATEYTPGAYAMPSVRDALGRGGADQALAHARVAIGSSAVVGFLGLAAAGMLTGSGPDDPAKRALWMRTGKQPFSVKLGDQWVKYNWFDPLGTIMGVTADMYEIGDTIGKDDADKVASMLVTSVALNLGDKTFLQGITDFSQAYTDPKRYASRWAQGLATSMIPNVGAQFAREADPYQRQARTLVDQAKSKIPGMREDLAKKLDIAGEPIEATGTGFGSPFSTTQDKQDVLADTMLKIGLHKGMPSRTITFNKRDVQLDDHEYEDYAGFIQKTRWQHLTPLVGSPQFQQLAEANPVVANLTLEKAWDRIGTEARAAYLYRHPDLIAKLAHSAQRGASP